MPASNGPQSSCLNSSANSYASLWDLRIQQACKVCVESLVSADELIGEGEAVHEATLLQPEYAAETAWQRTLSAQKPNHHDDLDQLSSHKACADKTMPFGVSLMSSQVLYRAAQKAYAKTVCNFIDNEWRLFGACNESRHIVHDLSIPAREEDALHSCKGHQPLRKAVRAATYERCIRCSV